MPLYSTALTVTSAIVLAMLPASLGAQQWQAVSPAPKVVATGFGLQKEAETPPVLAASMLPLVGTPGHLVPGSFFPQAPKASLPKVFAPSRPREIYTRYPWKLDIVTTVFWIGELPTANNPVPNTVSAWDRRWTSNFGGYDNPDPAKREGYLPIGFTPGQNPFYFALPYNDIDRSGTKESARNVVPWFTEAFYRNGRTVLKGRWIAIRRGDKVCYAQWEDVGPFETDDHEYVFGDQRPRTRMNRGAGLDVSPAVRDFLEFGSGYGTVDWRFVDVDEVPDGPWKQHGSNNPFANSILAGDGAGSASESILLVRELRDRLMASLDTPEAEKTTPPVTRE